MKREQSQGLWGARTSTNVNWWQSLEPEPRSPGAHATQLPSAPCAFWVPSPAPYSISPTSLVRSGNRHTPRNPLLQASLQFRVWSIKATFFLPELQPYRPPPKKSWSARTSCASTWWTFEIDDSPSKALCRPNSLGIDVSYPIDCLNESLF